ncbi:hypothetical protein BK816_07690 [Boudabousia tangfeifanii]|uniref:RAMA domain-containing protein n=1 Tax=Boudabousia tangfeifanii TaxID=1912795 RepID=A0A1D9MLE3_9ACTO|nr:hypothetical protein [Boudabousia tangfeifanii]AOZ73191.1 hypothetical protein BK816_07690 [Boudabousia tangfeifanii]
MALFEYENGRFLHAQFGRQVDGSIPEVVLESLRASVMDILPRPLFPVAWLEGDGTTPRLIALDASGQVVSVQVVARLESEELIAALSSLNEVRLLGWNELSGMYPGGQAAFRAGLADFRAKMPANPSPGPRLVVVAAEIAPNLRPAIDVLSASGMEVNLIALREMSNGRQFIEVTPLLNAFWGYQPNVIASGASPRFSQVTAGPARQVQVPSLHAEGVFPVGTAPAGATAQSGFGAPSAPTAPAAPVASAAPEATAASATPVASAVDALVAAAPVTPPAPAAATDVSSSVSAETSTVASDAAGVGVADDSDVATPMMGVQSVTAAEEDEVSSRVRARLSRRRASRTVDSRVLKAAARQANTTGFGRPSAAAPVVNEAEVSEVKVAPAPIAQPETTQPELEQVATPVADGGVFARNAMGLRRIATEIGREVELVAVIEAEPLTLRLGPTGEVAGPDGQITTLIAPLRQAGLHTTSDGWEHWHIESMAGPTLLDALDEINAGAGSQEHRPEPAPLTTPHGMAIPSRRRH